MNPQNERTIWKIRTVKNYPEAHNHLIVGRVIELHNSYVKLKCKTYHFKKVITSLADVIVNVEMVRIVPWNRIEIINELPSSFDYSKSQLTTDNQGRVVIKDDRYIHPLYSKYDKSY